MADPLSIAAGILAVLGGAGKTTQAVKYIWSLRHIGEDFAGLHNQVGTFPMKLKAAQS